MNGYGYRSYSSMSFGPALTPAVKWLLVSNVGVFILMSIGPAFPWGLFAMVPRLVFARLMLWQLVTYMFLHSGVFHLAVNMLMLWFFGPALEAAWGTKRFLFYYFFTGVGAALCSFIFSFSSSIIGASGALFGLMVAYAMMYPETLVLLFFFFPMKIRQAVLVFAAINLLAAVSSSGGGIAYVAHLGGGLFGWLYMKFPHVRSFDFGVRGLKARIGIRASKRKEDEHKTVDAILDKISRTGLKSLTPRERRILKKHSRSQ